MMRWKNHPVAVLAVLVTLHLLAHVDRNMLVGFSPQIIRDLDLSNTQYGFLVGAVWVLSFGFMAMFMGSLADRLPRPRLIAAGVAIWSICTAASGFAETFGQMVAARFFVASGEAALVPAAVALLSDLYAPERRAGATGIFFMGIPLGIGGAFLLSGTLGDLLGWRHTFFCLGAAGIAIAIPLSFLTEDRGPAGSAQHGEPFLPQMRALGRALRNTPALPLAITAFVLVHVVFASLVFLQLWLVKERGQDAAAIATRIGGLQLLFGALGSLLGGLAGDRMASRFKGGHASFAALIVGLAAPLMVACRFAPAGSPLFYAGLCAGFFMPLAVYGPAASLIQGLAPPSMRATIIGATMMAINLFAITLGNLAVGAAIDRLLAAGAAQPYTYVLLVTDLIAISSAGLFVLAARRMICARNAANCSADGALKAPLSR